MERLDEEKRRLVEENLGLVYFVLKKMGITRSHREFDDLFSAGCVGLCRAAQSWVRARAPFSTYAFFKIRHEVLDALDTARRAPLPVPEPFFGLCGADCLFDEVEARLTLEAFCTQAARLLGDTAARVIGLSVRGMPAGEICRRLHISRSAVQKARARARPVFREYFSGARTPPKEAGKQ